MKGGNYLNGTTMLILVCGSMLTILGLISAASHMYNLNGIKSKTVGDGQHGAARFATGQELLRTFKKVPYNPDHWRELGPRSTELKLPQGVIVGCKNKSSLVFQPGRKWPFRIRRQTYALVDTADVHTMKRTTARKVPPSFRITVSSPSQVASHQPVKRQTLSPRHWAPGPS